MDGRPVKLDLRPCKTCGRTFVPESLIKHEKSCKNIQKKRKVFDTTAQRTTDDLNLRQIKAAQKKTVAPPKSHWKAKHEEFVRNIRAAKGAQVAMERGDPLPPPPPPSLNPDYVTCPYCSRRFNAKAADRHIDFCKEQQKRVGNQRVPSQQEKARAAAKGYQPPKLKPRAPAGMGMDSPSNGSGGGYGASPSGPRAGPGSRAPPPGSRAPPPGSRAPPPGRSEPVGGRGAPPSGGRAPAGGGYSSGTTGYAGRGRGTTGARPTQYEVVTGDRGDMEDRPSAPRSAALRKTSRRPVPDTNLTMATKNNNNNTSPPFTFNSELMTRPSILKPRPNSSAAKFCHDCGTRYPTSQVKFCMECGIKRLDTTVR